MNIAISPEQNLLLACARSPFDRQSRDTIRNLLKERINWDRFFQLTRAHKIVPLCYLHLKEESLSVPENVLNRLHHAYILNSIKSLDLYSHLIKTLNAFSEANIDAVPIKGPILSWMLYERLSVRTFTDLDILIRPEKYEDAARILEACSYRPVEKGYSGAFIKDYIRHHTFEKSSPSGKPLGIEIHWNFYANRILKFDMDIVWRSLQSIELDGHQFLTLSPEYTLLHLAVNLRIHGYLNFRHYSDLSALLECYGKSLDWKRILRQAAVNRQKTALYYALWFSSDLCGGRVPPGILEKLKPPKLQKKILALFIDKRKIVDGYIPQNYKLFCDTVNFLTIDSPAESWRLIWLTGITHFHILRKRYIGSVSWGGIFGLIISPFRRLIKKIEDILSNRNT
ncbi:MAG: nucleotidyltransferase family protein [Candidatus Aminicenantes bacterium]|nr:nucleotidyltransferase family protein [Candidatus Aminicenantes bacterium]